MGGDDAARAHTCCEIFPHVLYTHIFYSSLWGARPPVIVYDSSHSTRTVFRVTACPLTSVDSKIEKGPCGDLSQSCSCWLRTFGRQPKSLARWASEVKKLRNTWTVLLQLLRCLSYRGLKVRITFKFWTKRASPEGTEDDTSIGRRLFTLLQLLVLWVSCTSKWSSLNVVLFRFVTGKRHSAFMLCYICAMVIK